MCGRNNFICHDTQKRALCYDENYDSKEDKLLQERVQNGGLEEEIRKNSDQR